MENKNNENVNENINYDQEGIEAGKDANGIQHIKVVDPKKETRKKIVIGFAIGATVAGLAGLAVYQLTKKKGNLAEIPVQVAQAAVQTAEPVKAAAPEAVNVAQDVVNGVQVAAF